MGPNWKRFDATRRELGPLELDLVESYAAGRVNRRDFLRRGVILGLSATQIAAACAVASDPIELARTPRPTRTPRADSDQAVAVSPTPTPEPTATPQAQAVSPLPGAGLEVGVQFGDANSGLDPLNMFDLGTYCVVSQSFEYLVGLAPDGYVGPTGLATSWSPNADGTQWTFDLRPDVRWHDGSPFTSADVAATIDRMVVARAGLDGVVSEGAVDIIDDLTVTVNLDRPNGVFPILVSVFNAQSLITPADYADSTTLDARPNGTGPWLIDRHDPASFTTTFVANGDYWGGRPNLNTVTLSGFESGAAQVAAVRSGELDVIQNFNAFDGVSLLDDQEFTVLAPPSANHRQLWFNTQLPEGGAFTDPRVRQAVAYSLDRDDIVARVFGGRAVVANDHPVHPSLPFLDTSAVSQRSRNVKLARQLIADAGFETITATIDIGDIAYSRDLATIVQQNCADAGIDLTINETRNSDFYGEQWCAGASYGVAPETSAPGTPCGASAAFGIVDYGHRPVPDVIFGRTLQTDGDWNASNYTSPEFDQLFSDYQAAVDVAGQTRAVSEMQQVLHRDAPVLIPAFFDYLAGHSASVSGVQATALGHLKLDRATRADG